MSKLKKTLRNFFSEGIKLSRYLDWKGLHSHTSRINTNLFKKFIEKFIEKFIAFLGKTESKQKGDLI